MNLNSAMKIKEIAKAELDSLTPDQLTKVYELIVSLKEKEQPSQKTSQSSYLAVRKALSNCKGSLSEDIHLIREDRI